MIEPATHTDGTPRGHLRSVGVVGLLALILGIAALGGSGWPEAGSPADPPPAAKEPTVGGIPLFAGWPKNVKPDAVLVLSGQTYGYLQPCGCSRPQFGGIERRANFIRNLKEKGWPVAAVDLGDVYPDKGVTEQAVLKYKTMMNALREMGYVAVGLGKTDLAVPGGIDRLLGEYALQNDPPPYLLGGNVEGVIGGKRVSREERFKPGGFPRSLVDCTAVATVGSIPVGVVGIVGKSLAEEVEKEKIDPSIAFADEKGVIPAALAALAKDPRKPQLYVLLYQGTSTEAAALAQAWPQFQVILCRADDSEPPQFPTTANNGKTLIIQVGHKGRFVGVLGIFKTAPGFDLKYQLVPLGEEQITPGTDAEAFKINPSLKLLQDYAEVVKREDFLGKIKPVPHPAQLREPKLNLSYIGSSRCQGCHQAESAKWAGTKHAIAMTALEKIAARPTLRNFDPECVVCHTVGHGYTTGYQDEKKTPGLKHVGCESCHGPGSAHAADPRNARLLSLQSPWQQQPGDKLPSLAVMKKLAEVNLIDRNKEEQKLPASEQRAINAVSAMCMKCHDMENDPHFNLYTYWPKVYHPSPKAAGGNTP